MDTGSKTLAQLSEENKEIKYVSLDTASHISGYTKDYLERLCRLNKVTYMLGPNGAFVIELESLLRETQAILLSYEGLTFVDKSELTEPVAQIGADNNMLSSASREVDTRVATLMGQKDIEGVEHRVLAERATREIPHFAESEDGQTGGNPFSFVGRAVVSDVEPQSTKHQKTAPKVEVTEVAPLPVSMPEQKLPEQPQEKLPEKPQEIKLEKKIEIHAEKIMEPTVPKAQIVSPVEVALPAQEAKPIQFVIPKPEPLAPPVVSSTVPSAMHIKVMTEHEAEGQASITPAMSGSQVVLGAYEHRSEEKHAEEKPRGNISTVQHVPTKLKIMGDSSLEAPPENEKVNGTTHVQIKEDRSGITSPYRPIQTSLDRAAHDDPAPLFPVIEKNIEVPEPAAVAAIEIVVEEPKIITHAFVEPTPVAATPEVVQPVAIPEQKTVVFHPAESVAAVPASPEKTVPSSVVMSNRIAAVERVIGVDAIPMKGISVAAMEKQDRVPSKPTLAAIPMHEEEHHLSIYEQHPLMKSTGFNAVFAVMLFGASFLMIGGTYLQSAGTSLNSATYVAGVGASLSNSASGTTGATTTTSLSPAEEVGTPSSGGVLPFSNDIVATSGEKANTVIVQPVSRDGSTGKAYEFMVVPVAK